MTVSPPVSPLYGSDRERDENRGQPRRVTGVGTLRSPGPSNHYPGTPLRRGSVSRLTFRLPFTYDSHRRAVKQTPLPSFEFRKYRLNLQCGLKVVLIFRPYMNFSLY